MSPVRNYKYHNKIHKFHKKTEPLQGNYEKNAPPSNAAKDITKYKKIISQFNKAKILVVGDLMLDEFIWGTVDRISPEAPVPVVWVKSTSFMPGGASNVANNIASLRGKVFLAGVIGKDESGGRLSNELEKKNINMDAVVIDTTRPTSVKTRIIAHHQQVVRIDKEKLDPISDATLEKIYQNAKDIIEDVDAIIIEDYGKGVIMPYLLEKLIALSKKHKKIIAVDPKVDHFSYYKGVTVLTPNKTEAEGASLIKINDDKSLNNAGQKLLKWLNSKAILVTLGENGMRLFEDNGNITHIPTVAQDVFDVSGAGDTVIGTMAMALACGASMADAAYISNVAAGIVVGKVGIAVVSQPELLDTIYNLSLVPIDKNK